MQQILINLTSLLPILEVIYSLSMSKQGIKQNSVQNLLKAIRNNQQAHLTDLYKCCNYNYMKKNNNHSHSREFLETVRQDKQHNPGDNYGGNPYSNDPSSMQQIYLQLGMDNRRNQPRGAQKSPYNNSHPYRNRTSTYNYPSYSKRDPNRIAQPVTSETIPILMERLDNLRKHYKTLIEEQKIKNTQKTQCILGFIDQMQAAHQTRIDNLRRMIEQADEQKRQAGFVDDKMNEIKSNIEQLITQSSTLKEKNQVLTKKIESKKKINDEKQSQLEDLKGEVLETRNQLEEFQIKNLKNNRINKEIIQIFKTATSMEQDE